MASWPPPCGPKGLGGRRVHRDGRALLELRPDQGRAPLASPRKGRDLEVIIGWAKVLHPLAMGGVACSPYAHSLALPAKMACASASLAFSFSLSFAFSAAFAFSTAAALAAAVDV